MFDKLLFMPAEFTVGAEYNFNDLEDTSIGYNTHTRQQVHIESLYAQNEWKNSHWSLLVGCRLDKHNLIDKLIASPRANLRYNPTEQISLRLSYASGFRAPQAFDEDMHIAVVGGERVKIRLANDLKEERSHSFSLSSDIYHRFGDVELNLLLEGFYTRLNDAFDLREVGYDSDGAQLLERYNSSGATVQDPEVAPEKRMFRTPDTYGFLMACFKPFKGFDIDLTGSYTGSMLVQHMAGYIEQDRAEHTRDFFDLGVKLSYDFALYKQVRMKLYAGVQNIFNAYQKDFDQGPDRDSGYVYGPALPRSWMAGIKVSF